MFASVSLAVQARLSGRAARLFPALEALFVTFLWSTSWVLIKIGLHDIPALTFAGLRYLLAFLCLLPFLLMQPSRLAELSRRDWGRLLVLGLLFYAVTQGTQFLALALLPAVTVSLILNVSTVVVLFLAYGLLAEHPTRTQWGGVALNLFGVLVYFYPITLPLDQVIGLAIAIVSMLSTSVSALLGRAVNRAGTISPLVVTTVSMGAGAILLAAGGIATQGLPPLSVNDWLLIAWLAVANTAVAFTLWNHTLRSLSAMQSNIINNTMLIQIAILAYVFLGEGITLQQGIGLALAAVGAVVVQLRRA